MISIHAPHEGERQGYQLRPAFAYPNFNPRSPRGGATKGRKRAQRRQTFQSTLPTRGSDCPKSWINLWGWVFQSTLPTRGSDSAPNATRPANKRFQSTLPTRGSDSKGQKPRRELKIFQSTLPTRGSDAKMREKGLTLEISIHAPHEGERRICDS